MADERISRHPPIEIEGKWRLADAAEIDRLRACLAEQGATRIGVEHEINDLFDWTDHSLRYAGGALRIRVVNGERGGRLTFKGPATATDGLKAREELETWVEDAAIARATFERLGFVLTLTYPKVRESWRLGGAEIALDELPFGLFCEIEGEPPTIASLAADLGLGETEPRSYPALMAEHLGVEGVSAPPIAAADVVRGFLDAMFDPAQPPEAATRFVSPNVRFVEQPNQFLPDGRVGGFDTIVPGINAGRAMFASQRFVIDQLVADGEAVVVRSTWEGTTHGSADGPAQLLRASSALFFTVRYGLIVEEITHDCFDPPRHRG